MGPHYDAAFRQQQIIASELDRLNRYPQEEADAGRQIRTLLCIAALLIGLPMVFGS
ncbi:MAG: hypothetical protein AAGK00_11525 [Pseudomonadota bacterium]